MELVRPPEEFDDTTPTDGAGQWLPILKRFDKLDKAMATIANEQLLLRQELRGLGALKDRVAALELQRLWFPLAFSMIAIVIACYALAKGHG